METTVALHAGRPFSAALYLSAALLNGCVLHAAMHRLGICALPALLGLLTAAGALVLTAALFPRTGGGQFCGRAATVLYAMQPVLLWASAAGIPCLLLPGGIRGGITVCALFLLASVTAVVGYIRARRICVTRYRLTTKQTFPGGRLRIVHLSDLHLGFVNDRRMLSQIVRLVRSLQPDLICITGDTFEHGLSAMENPASFAGLLASIRPQLGIYACLGNHDAGRDFPAMLSFFRKAGITLLRDEIAFPHPSVRIAGRRDATPGGRRNPHRKTAAELLGERTEAYTVLLDHQPQSHSEAKQAGADLLLCGHTHGGQFFPVGLLVRLRFPHMKGIRREGDFCTVVSAGSGAGSPPIRLGSRGEIAVVDVLTKK